MTTHRLVAGTLSQNEFDNNVYDLTARTRPSGMPAIVDWFQPLQESPDVFHKFAQVVDSWDGRAGFGGSHFEWWLGPMNSEMVTQLRSDLSMTAVESALVTARTNDGHSGLTKWPVVNATILWPDSHRDMRRIGGEMWMLRFKFINATISPVGPDVYPSSVTQDIDFVVSSDGVYTITITNSDGASDGGASTYDDVVVIVELDTDLDLVSTTAAAWDVEYSTNGVDYSGTPPSPISDTTHLRYTYTSTLAPGENASTIAITVNPSGSTNVDLTVTSTTSGDTDTGNDELIHVTVFA